ncbi:hypothetical protein [Nocardioides soli]|uniref:YbjN domain-containing protein n=1 Tax=Nocardioides soli TaxID=1036020 RepID=A0A7W4VUR7_9ACTN|nr:hypothetical protein [Nocardioides soli]MBB3041893.1 hypothetical protein [Nocardioides soli]
MDPVRQAVLDYLDGQSWDYDEHDTFIGLNLAGQTGEWPVVFFMPPDTEVLIVYSILPVEVSPEWARNVSSYLTAANFGLSIGSFEVDLAAGPRYGEVRYRTSVELRDVPPSTAIVRNLVDANVATVDAYLSGLLEAAQGRPFESCIADAEGAD